MLDSEMGPLCGVRGAAASGSVQGGTAQIVGGTAATPLEFPWQISLHLIQLPNTDLGHICGGSIINKQYVDTAAHCILDGYKSPSNYIVVIGDQNLNVVDPYEQRIAVANIMIHPQWNRSTVNYDYALLKLARPLNFTGSEKALMPICLPTPNQEFDGMTCTASGWGLTKDESRGGRNLSQSLQKVDLPIVAYTTCHDYYRFVNPVVQSTMICAGPEAGGKGSCQKVIDKFDMSKKEVTKELLLTLHNKIKYVLYYRNMKLYMRLELKVTKLQRY
ncbi:trypsin-1-like [Ixodes scapularis]|uniref:trypsin-1-like n=1 Tax=Ixodes scapularis TaxID=6945 RepID=UPI001C38E11A|nr:trypsin-1-like [Ixodes scapularis]